mmetsp:Transcript_111980/g.316556  ORF Transcript_111980/g.316556 Transcript_111980/m.316556 type:complete len:100 (+) Transcript_111980:801-1100(+)
MIVVSDVDAIRRTREGAALPFQRVLRDVGARNQFAADDSSPLGNDCDESIDWDWCYIHLIQVGRSAVLGRIHRGASVTHPGACFARMRSRSWPSLWSSS